MESIPLQQTSKGPLLGPDQDASANNISKRRNREQLGGWRRSLLLGCVMSVVVLFFNIGFTGYAVQHHRVQDGRGVLYEGSCETVKNANIGFHLIINIFSTALLSASNFCMQCLCAPTRRDIDRAHHRRKWLDIGVPSTRNLFQVSKKRSWLWICLIVSSVPLHLLYNSTIFSSIGANSYNVYAGRGLLTQTALSALDAGLQSDTVFLRLYEKAHNGTLYRLDNSACVDAYATAYQSRYGSLILATDDVTPANHYAVAASQAVFNPAHQAVVGASGYNWICQDLEHHQYEWQITPCITDLPQVRTHVGNNNWTVGGYKVDYCLAEELIPHCKLQYTLPLVLMVIAFNIIKAIVLCYVAFTTTDDPLLTTGDAVASFLNAPDRFSQGMGLVPADAIRRPSKYGGMPTFDARPKRWRSAISRRRWGLGLGLYSTALLVCVALLALGLTLSFDSTGIWSVGLGEVATQSILSLGPVWIPSVLSNAVLANLPQLIFSGLYFAANGLATTMALAHEWSQYAIQRKGLRVSTRPLGAQRRSYFLSLPYRYAVPLIILSILIHWLISESLFLVMVEAYSVTRDRQPDYDVTSCGYSPTAIVATIAVGAVLLLALVGLSYRRFRSGMPVAGSCSVAIAAACHPGPRNPGDESPANAPRLPLQWGVVQVGGGVRHCAFSSAAVDMPEHGLVCQ